MGTISEIKRHEKFDLEPRHMVALKSGGPAMMVRSVRREKDVGVLVECDWFNKEDDYCSADFLIEQLERLEEKPLAISTENASDG